MNSAPPRIFPKDQPERDRALDPTRSILVQAPAGSGKTTLLSERFLALLAEVDDPGKVVAITFTNAAAAEMRNRILEKLDNPEPGSLARRALDRSNALGWNLLDLPAQLRISTIDSFCRELALQQPLLSSFGGALNIASPPDNLYRQAARRTLESMDRADATLRGAIADLLAWRDNNWSNLEDQVVDMLSDRDRWMQSFLLERAPDWELLRSQLERPFAPLAYSEEEWRIVRASFTLLRYTAAQLKVVFAENAAVDFTEVAQIAQSVLREPDGSPSDAAMAVADGIHHLLVDEFQDTSRRQHQLLSSLVAAWPDRSGRTCFVVGDPMQSIYFFRNAEAELFFRVRDLGLEIPNAPPFQFDFVQLTANFRTAPPVVVDLNEKFERIFAENDGSGIEFSPSEPQRTNPSPIDPSLSLHLAFVPHVAPFKPASPETRLSRQQAQEQQVQQIVAIIRSHVQRIADLRETFKAKKEKYRVAVLARVKKSLAPIAEALRNAHIPFRAIELEGLADRPEILDALAVARALLQPQDRVAWLGVLRAPWCGLSLADLNTLAGTSDSAEDDRTARTIPDLLAERIHLLSPEARPAADRVLRAITLAPTLRAAQPTAALGTWLQQVWLSLGGDATVDAIARANVDLFFARLDLLPNSDSDLIGPALDAALKDLNALPNPEADADFGVQLMTIHKSKGLEFEVVLVPDLQLEDRNAHRSMLSWLERGLPPDIGAEATGEVTEFLIAPIQSKGSKRGSVKEIVDQARRLREQQETRRILYVAATRARDELHLLARPNYKVEANGELSLIEPSTGLLATAWPALEEQTRARFDEWKSTRKATAASNTEFNAEIESLAASAGDLIVLPSTAPPAAKPTLLRRLPADYAPTQMLGAQLRVPQVSHLRPGKAPLYTRHEGGLLSRALGTAVHALLEELARLRATDDWHTVRASLKQHEPRIAAQVRAAGIAPQQSAQVAANALQIVLSASQDPLGQWILSAHPEADNEVRWAGVVAGTLTNVRVDRVFRAGLIPQSDGHAAWWIVDYKTAYDDNLDPTSALTQWRPRFAPQLETYANVLRNLHGADAAIRAGLYYPRMSLLDWWEL